MPAQGQLIYLTAELTDAQGIRKMLVDHSLTVTVEGAGQLLAIGSSNPVTEESYQQDHFMTHMGALQIIVKREHEAGQVHIVVEDEQGLKEEMTIF